MTKQNKITTAILVVIIILVVVYFMWIKPRKERLESESELAIDTTSTSGKPFMSTGHKKGAAFEKLPSGSFPLKKGDQSKLVYILQKALNDLKGAGLTLDGDFGNATEKALMSFYRVKSVDQALGQRIYTEYQTRAQQQSQYADAADSMGRAMGII